MRYLIIPAAFTLLLAISSCSYIQSKNTYIQPRDREYMAAKSIPPLSIPPGLSSSTIQAEYPVSDRQYPESKKTVNLLPPELK